MPDLRLSASAAVGVSFQRSILVVTHGAKELIDSITGNGYVSHSVGFIVCGRRTAASKLVV